MNINIFSSNEDKEKLQQIYKSSIRASYFNHMGANKFTQQSRIQIQKKADEEDVNQNTFRIMRKFSPPETTYTVVKQNGVLTTQSGGGFFACFGRKQSEATLKNSVLQIYTGNNLKYYFDFDVVNGSVQDKKDRFTVKLKTCNKSFDFYPLQNPTSREWTEAIQLAIKNSDGKKYDNEQICKIPQFYKKPYIHYQEFQKLANTGDIILFRSEHSAARVQQVFLNSEYDHVAVILRNKKNQIVLYESSSFDGVGFTQWKHMISYEWYKSTEKMAWKKLNFKFENHHYDTVEAFIAKTLGKQFQITLNKVFSFQSKIQREKSEQDSKTYFCSELVARMYKELGLLDPNVSCTQYYPVTFSDKGSLKFTDSRASLDKEYIIAF